MKKRRRHERKTQFVPGSGNVFADLNLPNPEKLLAEAEAEYARRSDARIAALTQLAVGVWEDEGAAEALLRSPQPALGGSVPLQLARTAEGCREVERLLMQIEHRLLH